MSNKNLWVKKVQEKVIEKQEEENASKKAICASVREIIAYTPPEGLFTKGPEAIASKLKSDSKDLKQAMSRLNFYINRAGGNLTAERKKVLEKAKELLHKKYKTN